MKKLIFIILSVFTIHAQSIVSPLNNTIVGWFVGNPPVIDGYINESTWTAPYSSSVTTGTSTFGAGLNNGMFPNLINVQVSVDDKGVVQPTVPAPPPAPSMFNTTASFGLAWDNTYLYFAAIVYDPNLNFNVPNIPPVQNGLGVELYFAMDKDNVSKKTSLAAVWPPVLNNGWEGQLFLNNVGTANNPLTTLNKGNGGGVGMIFTDNDVLAYAQPVTHPITGQGGYAIEASIKWEKLNNQWINPSNGSYTDSTKKPLAGRIFRFDIGNTISKGNPLVRVAKQFWNMCCFDDNYQEAQYYGTAILSGLNQVVCPTSLTPQSSSTTIGTALGNVNLSPLTPTPQTATAQVKWQIINPNPTLEIAGQVNSAGLVSAINNGIVTVMGTSTCSTTTSAISIITITGQSVPTGLTIQTTATSPITGMWQKVPFTANVIGSGVLTSQQVIWSVQNPSGKILATINSLTGILRSTSVGNGVVTITATSVANSTVKNSITLSVEPVLTLSSCNTWLTSFAYGSKCRTFKTLTLAGFTNSIPLSTVYYVKDSVPLIVPPELFNYKIKNITKSAELSTSSDYSIALFNAQASGTFTLTGTYLNDTTLKIITIVRLNSSKTSLLTTSPGCTGNLVLDNVNPSCNVGIVQNITDKTSKSRSSVYPNPSTGDVNVMVNENAEIELFDIIGNKIQYAHAAKAYCFNIAIRGIYLIRVAYSNGESDIHKVIIQP
ncbi:MAG: T9SS type A sorting domain-containing protein [Bacteroidota bacterium]|nr:T9SS type A sorting domain-containing protein [Bacteroidota bacterium]